MINGIITNHYTLTIAMTSDLSYAEHVLAHLGFKVDPIEETDEETADWIASIAGEVVLVEEKTKLEAPTEVIRRAAAHEAGQPYDSHTPFTPDNRLSGISRTGLKSQLDAGKKDT